MIKATNEVSIIAITLIIPGPSTLPIAPVRGLIRPNKIRNVNTTATWARTRFPFLKPGVIINRIIPVNTGIRAVTEGVREAKYAQLPRIINTSEFRKFIK